MHSLLIGGVIFMTEKRLLPMNLQLFANKPEEVTEPQVDVAQAVEKIAENTTTETVEPEVIEVEKEPDKASEYEKKISELDQKVTELEQENTELKQKLDDKESTVTELTDKLTESGKSVKQATSNIEKYQKSLEEIVAEKEKGIPDTVKALMPEGINVTEKLVWLNKAEALKTTEEKIVKEPEQIVSIGKPTPLTAEVIDQSELSTTQRMSNFFGEFFGTEK